MFPDGDRPGRRSRFYLGVLLLGLSILVLGIGLSLGYRFWTSYTYPHRVVNEPLNLMDEPDQDPLPFEMDPVKIKRGSVRYWVLPRYRYRIVGEVLIADSYWFGPMADISPLDLSLGWGYLVHPRVQKHLSYDHGDRFYTWRIREDAPPNVRRSRAYIVTHSSNNHLIPANDRIEYALSGAEAGDKVKLTGYLVNVYKFNENGEPMARPWTTSTHRRDHGASGCEILYVLKARINDRLYESSFNAEEYRRSDPPSAVRPGPP